MAHTKAIPRTGATADSTASRARVAKKRAVAPSAVAIEPLIHASFSTILCKVQEIKKLLFFSVEIVAQKGEKVKL